MLNRVTVDRQDTELDALAALQEKTPNDQILVYSPQESNLVLISGRGKWTKGVLAAHFTQLHHILQSKRRRFPTTRILCDVRERGDQTPEILEEIRVNTTQLYGPADRLAIVTSSSLMKMTLRQQMDHKNIQFFISIETAKTWLDAYL